MPRHASGATPAWASEIESGRPDSSTRRRSIVNSAAPPLKSDTTCRTPLPVPPSARAMPTSSSSLASRLGVGEPSLERWFSVRDVEKPSAPASTAAAARRDIRATSSGVAVSRLAPRSPIT